jgi:hypothetical protein
MLLLTRSTVLLDCAQLVLLLRAKPAAGYTMLSDAGVTVALHGSVCTAPVAVMACCPGPVRCANCTWPAQGNTRTACEPCETSLATKCWHGSCPARVTNHWRSLRVEDEQHVDTKTMSGWGSGNSPPPGVLAKATPLPEVEVDEEPPLDVMVVSPPPGPELEEDAPPKDCALQSNTPAGAGCTSAGVLCGPRVGMWGSTPCAARCCGQGSALSARMDGHVQCANLCVG